MDEKEKFEERKQYNAPFLCVFDYLAKEKLMNQGQFAKVIDSESGYISLLRTGKKKVGADYIARIAAEFAKHFDDQQHLNLDYIDGKSPYMILENVPDEEIYEKLQRGANPDYDLMKQREPAQQPHQPTAFENAMLLEKAIASATAYQDKLVANLEKQVADKDQQLAQRDEYIAMLRQRIEQLEAALNAQPDESGNFLFPQGVADKNEEVRARV